MSRLNIMGVGVDPFRFEEAVDKIDAMIAAGGPHHVVTVNPEYVSRALRDSAFRRLLNDADLATPDGFGIRLAASYLNSPVTWLPFVREAQLLWQGFMTGLQAMVDRSAFAEVPELVTGVDLVWALAKKAAAKGYSVYLLDRTGGLRKDTVNTAANRLKQVHPTLHIVGTAVVDPTDQTMVGKIARLKPDILLVAFGFPEQDFFIAQNKDRLGAGVAIGVGGTFDYIAGNRPRPPRLLRGKYEWLWRFLIPAGGWAAHKARIRRIMVAFPLFPWEVFKWKLKWGAGLSFPRALSLDFGGVLHANGVETLLKQGSRLIPWRQWPAFVFFYFGYIRQLELGKISEVEVWTKFMSRFGTRRDLASLRHTMINGFTPNEPIWQIVREQSQLGKVKLALLTNNVTEWMAIWEKRFKLSKYFDPVVASCSVHLRKPNPDIYRDLLNKLNLPAQDVIFIDDHNRNVWQARRLGFRSIRCEDAGATARDLRQILPA